MLSREGAQHDKQPEKSSHTDADNGPQNPGAAISRVRKAWDLVVWLALDQWFLIVLGILIAIASQHPVPESEQELKTTVVDYLCVTVIFFINGCTTSTRSLMLNLSFWKVHLFVQILSFLLTSAVVFGIISAAATNRTFMDPALSVGMIVMGCLPTAIAFNVAMTTQAHGSTPLTVVESVVGNFIGPFVSPLLVEMYISTGAWYTQFLPRNSGGIGEIYKRVFKQLGLTIFLPIVVGQFVQNLIPNITDIVFKRYKLSKLGSLALLILIWSTFDAAFASDAFAVRQVDMIFVVFVSVGLFLVWFLLAFVASLGWLPREDAVSAMYCIPTKTPATGVPLVQVMFIGLSAANLSKIKLPMVIFQGIQVLLCSLSTIPLRKWIDNGKEKSDEEKGST